MKSLSLKSFFFIERWLHCRLSIWKAQRWCLFCMKISNIEDIAVWKAHCLKSFLYEHIIVDGFPLRILLLMLLLYESSLLMAFLYKTLSLSMNDLDKGQSYRWWLFMDVIWELFSRKYNCWWFFFRWRLLGRKSSPWMVLI